MTTQGPISGEAVSGEGACAYKGIPYAAAPMGELRWRPPQDAPNHTAVLKAAEFGPQCMQVPNPFPISLFYGRVDQSEDCLYLNVWRPAKSGSFPVMVWIHGGDLLTGSGSETMYWGDRLAAAKDVVLVTINYRLGPFGYFYHRAFAAEDAHQGAGNYGLLDQVKSLEWVRDNIEAFGGDPHNVTIFGESAGGWSVCLLLASPRAAGLFHRAVIESGGCECGRTVAQGESWGDVFASRLGCSGKDAAACLRAKSSEEIIAAMGQDWQAILGKFFPHEDGYALVEKPLSAIQAGRYNKVPLMVGSNKDEFKLFTLEIPGGRSLPGFMLQHGVERHLHTTLDKGLERIYPPASYRKTGDAVFDALGDAYLGCPGYRSVNALAQNQPPAFYYRFDYNRSRFPHLIGAAHAMEVPFIFGGLDRDLGNVLYTGHQAAEAEPLSEIMMSYWTNFARTGNPNGPGLPEWPAYTAAVKQRNYLDQPVHPGASNMEERCEYWGRQNIDLH